MQPLAIHATGLSMRPILFCCLLVCALGLANVRGQQAKKKKSGTPGESKPGEGDEGGSGGSSGGGLSGVPMDSSGPVRAR